MPFLRTFFRGLSLRRQEGRSDRAIATGIPKSVASYDTASMKSTPSLEKDILFDPDRILSASQIHSYKWGEYALVCYGIPTIAWAVFLLVDDPEAAAQVLLDGRFNGIS